MSNKPSLRKDHISQIPALQLLQNLGYKYLTPEEALEMREGKKSQVILTEILDKQLRLINKIDYRGEVYPFSNHNIDRAVRALLDFPFDGLVRTSEKVFDLISLGRSFEETIAGDTKSFSLKYIDWKNWQNNVFHVTAEFEVERRRSKQTYRPDIVVFVNGIPFVVIECKRPDKDSSIDEAIGQHIRNQKEEGIPHLYIYSQVLMAIDKNKARYGTTGTPRKFWSLWRFRDEKSGFENQVQKTINQALSLEQKGRLFSGPFQYCRKFFDELEDQGQRKVTEQDRVLYSLCQKERLLDLSYRFVVFDGGEKKIARYQQYYAVKKTMNRIRTHPEDKSRKGGVIWHTQGSGKSLTMVMLAKSIALDEKIINPRIVLVTDRVDLDDQIYRTFEHCGKHPTQAKTGKHLCDLIVQEREAVITTVIDKFEAALAKRHFKNESLNIFVLVDESHRSQYGIMHAKMRKVLPKACFLGFTGTPLMKEEKNTVLKFGGMIHTYTIDQAVKDKAVVPLIYEGREAKVKMYDPQDIDEWFVTETTGLTKEQRADLKKKYSSAQQISKARERIKRIAFDITNHYVANWQGTNLKGQLAVRSRKAALKYKEFMDLFGKVSTEVLISGPDSREGSDDVYTDDQSDLQRFWKKMMDKFGNETEYNRQVINQFKHGEHPEIIIVVDKLLTGFDAPRNTVLYIDKPLRGHNLLQAIARVNRLQDGKDYGFIIDYEGLLGKLDQALTDYKALEGYDERDLEGTLQDIEEEVKKLPQKHSELWDIFKEIPNKKDEEAYEQLLADEELRHRFYEKLSAYARVLKTALSQMDFHKKTPPEKLNRYKEDLRFFMNLRASVGRRYAEKVDFKEYEDKIQKLIDSYIGSDKVEKVVDPVNIFDKKEFDAEVDKVKNPRAKADTILHRLTKTISEKMEEDPVFYKKFSELIEETIKDLHYKRISDAEGLKRALEYRDKVQNHRDETLPNKLENKDHAQAFYRLAEKVYQQKEGTFDHRELAADTGLKIDEIIRDHKVVEWKINYDIQNDMKNAIEDYLYKLNREYDLDLTFQEIDDILENSIHIARSRYPDE